MIGERLKRAIEMSGRERSEVAAAIGISEGNLYKLFKKDSFEVDYLRKASTFLEKPMSYFLVDIENSDSDSLIVYSGKKNISKGDSWDSALKLLAEKIDSLTLQLQAKDQQIAGLQRTLEVLAGKYRGVIVDLLSTDAVAFEGVLNVVQQAGFNLLDVKKPLKKRPLAKSLAPVSASC